MVTEERKILFFIDNCTAHNLTSTLNAIQMQFLSPNTTSVLQPLNQGIINNFKIFYRNYLFKPLGILENRIENNVLNNQKQLILH
jgi:hypothetical protein